MKTVYVRTIHRFWPRAAFLRLLMCSLTATAGCGLRAVSEEVKAFQGTWTAVSVNGKDSRASLTFTGNRIAASEELEALNDATFSVDAGKVPKEIDVVFLEHDFAPQLIAKNKAVLSTPRRGIYERHGDELRICLATGRKMKVEPPDKIVEVVPDPRPTDFKPEAGTLLILRRSADHVQRRLLDQASS